MRDGDTHSSNKFNPSNGNIGKKNGTEIEGKAIPRLFHMGIHLICSYQTQTLLLMPRVLADRSLIHLSLERLRQSLTHTYVDVCSQ